MILVLRPLLVRRNARPGRVALMAVMTLEAPRTQRILCEQGTDIRRLSQESLAILTNPSLLAIDKDPNCVRWRCTFSTCARVANLECCPRPLGDGEPGA